MKKHAAPKKRITFMVDENVKAKFDQFVKESEVNRAVLMEAFMRTCTNRPLAFKRKEGNLEIEFEK